MNNTMMIGYENMENAAALTINTKPGNLVFYYTGERFLHSAALLPEGEFLGWQVFADEDKTLSGITFSSSGLSVTHADYVWIFQGSADLDPNAQPVRRDLNEGNRRLYVLMPDSGSKIDTGLPSKKENWFTLDDDLVESGTIEYFHEMSDMLMEADAVVRMVAGPAEGKEDGHGMILISLPGEMTLRMRTAISLAFPQAAAVEIENPADGRLSPIHLTDNAFLAGMVGFLDEMLRSAKKAAGAEEKEEDEEEFLWDEDTLDADNGNVSADSNSHTPIEELHLSVRAYNCLKRAGICSVEKLRTMTEEEILRIRNMGRKCAAEIRQKLDESRTLAKVVPLEAPSYMEMLDELIGLDAVKEQVRRIAAFARMKQDMAACGRDALPVALNMEFVGNPGTAKTTVARIIAGIFQEIGLLAGNEIVEVGRADLVARYEGQTAEKVRDVFRKAEGKLLFIDEAYSLVENWEGEYGDEAISTIVQEMENNRENTIVIFAGYPDKMNDFFARNPGLRSRVPFRIHFQDYSAEEMLRIAEFEAEKRGFAIEPAAKEKILSICEAAAGDSDMGNGRFSRNLIENAILGFASRVYGTKESARDTRVWDRETWERKTSDQEKPADMPAMKMELKGEDFSVPEMLEKSRKTGLIGFRS